MAIEGNTQHVVIGTSGSTDYLNDGTGDRRFWPVRVLIEDLPSEDGHVCDGLHDECAPVQHLCSRCFPNFQGDLLEIQDDEYNEVRRDDNE